MQHAIVMLQYTFKLKRDEHSSFTFAFDDKEQAYRWFDALSQVNALSHTAELAGALSAAAGGAGGHQPIKTLPHHSSKLQMHPSCCCRVYYGSVGT